MTDRDDELRLAALEVLYGGDDGVPCNEVPFDVTTTEVTCERVIELLTEYVDEELEPQLRNALDGHLDACPPCGSFLDEYRVANTTFREHLLTKVPTNLEKKLISFLRAQCQCAKKSGDEN